MYPIFHNFKGGKGVATALGILLAINWELALFTLLIWIIIFFISKYSSLSAIIAAIASPLIAYTSKSRSVYYYYFCCFGNTDSFSSQKKYTKFD
jgi:acyl-phosphate glycerol 3-phosphate acyltransferase